MKATVQIELEGPERVRITDMMSTAMGSFIQATGKFDFTTWTAEEWQRFTDIAFDVCAPEVFLRRIVLVRPYEEVPYA